MLTEDGRMVLKGEAPFQLREDVLAPKGKRRRASSPPTPRDADADLLAALKALRAAMAKAANQPAYVIFPDRTLIEMAKAEAARRSTNSPRSTASANSKLQKYGAAFLAVVKDHA